MSRDNMIVKLKLDVVFKRMFGDENNKDIIAAFVAALLEIPQESIREIYINNVEMGPIISSKNSAGWICGWMWTVRRSMWRCR